MLALERVNEAGFSLKTLYLSDPLPTSSSLIIVLPLTSQILLRVIGADTFFSSSQQYLILSSSHAQKYHRKPPPSQIYQPSPTVNLLKSLRPSFPGLEVETEEP